MKTAVMIVMSLVLACFLGCKMSPRGGNMSRSESFRISIPLIDMVDLSVKQGELQTVTVTLHRGSMFKQDVKLAVKTSGGISVEPMNVTIKASDKPEVQLRITAAKDAALGEYPIVVKGTPETGETTSVGFTIKVVAP